MPDVRLTVNGRAYGGWTSVRVTRGMEAIAGSFDLSVSERWGGQVDPWPIAEEDECTLAVDGEVLITGYVDRRAHAIDAESHELSVAGRDKAGALVDCSAVLNKWEFLNEPVLDLCTKLAAPFGIKVSLQEGLDDKAVSLTSGKSGGAPSAGKAGTSSSLKLSKPTAKLTVNPGDSPFEVIDRVCRMVGVLPVSDGAGGIVLTRAGGTRAVTALEEGQNILGGESTFDASRRYRRYLVSGQQGGTDDVFGTAAAAVKAEAQDLQVRREARVLLVRPDSAVTLEFAKQRAAWENTVRAARSATATITVQGWHQGDGTLWPYNALVPVRSRMLGLDGVMLITQTTFALSVERGTTTTLSLVRPDAFIPEPVIAKTSGGSTFRWHGGES